MQLIRASRELLRVRKGPGKLRLRLVGSVRNLLFLCLLFSVDAQSQNLAPNPSFEQGTSQPTDWAREGEGQWDTNAHSGSRAIYFKTPACNNLWRSSNCPVQAGAMYVVRFWAKAGSPYSEASGILSAGWDQVSRHILPEDYWRQHSFIAVMPKTLPAPTFRFSQCNVSGGLHVDDLEVRPVVPINLLVQGQEACVGETLTPGGYLFQPDLGAAPAAFSRELNDYTAVFDSWRWTIKPGSYVTYRHTQGERPLTAANLELIPYWADAGALIIETGRDGVNWAEAGRIEPPTYGYLSAPLRINLAASLFPATNTFVRLRSTTGTFKIKGYRFEATVPDNQVSALGKTWFFELDGPVADARLMGMVESGTGWVCRVELRNPGTVARQLGVSVITEGPAGSRTNRFQRTLAASSSAVVDTLLPSAGAGENVARMLVWNIANGSVLLKGSLPFTVAALQDNYFGYGLPGVQGCEVWWCESTHKVSRSRRENPVQGTAVEISAARNEYEPFQVVLRPQSGLVNAQANVSDFSLMGQPQTRIASTNVELCLVEYVSLWQASDYSGTTGEHPDPLIPLTNSFSCSANSNQPLWVTVYVPKETPAGLYEAILSIKSDNVAQINVPIRLRVYDFALSDTTHTKTSYRGWLDEDWYKLSTVEQKRAVWDLYMQNYRRHRITPTHPHNYAPISWTVEGEEFALDTADFDTAMSRYLDEFGFNGFKVFEPPESIGPYARHSADYRRLLSKLTSLIMAHLREKGWDRKGYIWWYDEPYPAIYPNLIGEMKAIQAGAPDLRRITTYQPDPPIHDSVEIWTPLLTSFRWLYNRVVPRQKLGEEFWWYICCWPPYPQPNNFIDHPGVNHRIRPWMAERFDVRGDLYWSIGWYKTTNGVARNPWLDPMSGLRTDWLGNGDGVLLYPPVRTLPSGPVMSGPLNSLRWELLRESMEDGEYFWLLRQGIERGLGRLGLNHPAVLEGYAAREQALAMVRAVDDFDKSPRQMNMARQRIAEAIEALEDGTPWIVNQPVGKAERAGGSASLRVDALGWPLPQYQWYRDGLPVPGETQPILRLPGLTLSQSGLYHVVVSNALGSVASDQVMLAVRTSGAEAPRIVSGPLSLQKQTGEKAVLSATVVGSTPISYRWTFDGSPVTGATDTTLLFTNLTANQFGSYRLTASNALGMATSPPARIYNLGKPLLVIERDAKTGKAQLTFPVRGHQTTILASTNMSQWTPLARFQTPSDSLKILITEGIPLRYYRIMMN